METIKNDFLKIGIDSHGAELCSIKDKAGNEYLWQADPAFWKRHSPILFPIVGSVNNGEFMIDGHHYHMSQHGFARDSDFTLTSHDDRTAWYELKSNEATLQNYPYRFTLHVSYTLTDNTIEVMWRVHNDDSREMYFQIGAHPAFYYPDYGEDGERGYLRFDKDNQFEYLRIGQNACASLVRHTQMLDDRCLKLDTHTFDIDTFIIEGGQIRRVELLDKQKRPYLTMRFDAPVLGLWSPPKKNAPFVCIEPWYGRCDRENFSGEFSERDHVNRLTPGATFTASYKITIDRATLA